VLCHHPEKINIVTGKEVFLGEFKVLVDPNPKL
jgi:hypothetical protein